MTRLLCLVGALAALGMTSPLRAQDHVDAPSNAVEQALVAAVHGEGRPSDFEAAFMAAPVYIRIEPETYAALQKAQTDGVSPDSVQIQAWAVEPFPGVQAVAVYLSEAGFNRDHPKRHWLRIPGRNALAFAQSIGAGLYVTDGGGDEKEGSHTVTWTAPEVGVLLTRYPAPASEAATR